MSKIRFFKITESVTFHLDTLSKWLSMWAGKIQGKKGHERKKKLNSQSVKVIELERTFAGKTASTFSSAT